MNCPNCRQPLQEGFKFCPYCGADTAKGSICPSCKQEVKPEWMACPNCGVKLQGRPQQNFGQNYQPPSHQGYGGHHYGSSSGRHRKKGFLGHLFSS